MNNDDENYDRGILKLIEIVKKINAYETSANHVSTIKARLSTLLKSLELSSDELGDIYNELMLEEFIDEDSMSYKATLSGIECLAGACNKAINSLPDSRKRHALNYAAKGFLHLKYFAGNPRPKLTNNGTEVKEFSLLCTKAGLPRSDEACRNSLSSALENFDPHITYDQFTHLYH